MEDSTPETQIASGEYLVIKTFKIPQQKAGSPPGHPVGIPTNQQFLPMFLELQVSFQCLTLTHKRTARHQKKAYESWT